MPNQDELREWGALALFDVDRAAGLRRGTWEQASEGVKDRYRLQSSAVLAAASSTAEAEGRWTDGKCAKHGWLVDGTCPGCETEAASPASSVDTEAGLAVEIVPVADVREGEDVLVTGQLGALRKTVFSILDGGEDGYELTFTDADSWTMPNGTFPVVRVLPRSVRLIEHVL